MVYIFISNFLNFNNFTGHKDIDFLDIDLDRDTRLFIDPSLIAGSLDSWCTYSNDVINSFFDTIFTCLKDNNNNKLKQLLDYGHEPNETKLGMSLGKPKGKGTTSDGLYDIFKTINTRDLIAHDLILNPMDVCVFVHDFGKDKMSDLVTNILRKQLNEFTLSQCNKYNIPISSAKIKIGAYWDCETKQWKDLIDYALLVNGKPILLVPKSIVRDEYIYSLDTYLSKKVIEFRQNFHLKNQTSLCRLRTLKNGHSYFVKPSKKKLYKLELKGVKYKDYVTSQTIENPNLIIDFRSETYRRIALGDYTLNDTKLDEIVYRLNIDK